MAPIAAWMAIPGLASPLGIALVTAGVVIGLLTLQHLIFGVPYPEGVALIREPPGARRFSLRTRLAYYTDCRRLYDEAWHNVRLFSPSHTSRATVLNLLALSSTPNRANRW